MTSAARRPNPGSPKSLHRIKIEPDCNWMIVDAVRTPTAGAGLLLDDRNPYLNPLISRATHL